MCLTRSSIIPALVGVLVAKSVAAQIPDKFTNLKVLPAGIPRDSLVNIMRTISLSLNVRCQFCHVGGDGVSFAGVDFAKDDDPDKLKARFMLQMVDSLNRVVIPKLPGVSANPVRIECKTCHRGVNKPLLLTQALERVRADSGINAAVARYRFLRQNAGMAGAYDFGEWEMNLWAEKLATGGRQADAIAVYQLNLEFFPRSVSILTTLGRLLEPTDKVKAIEYYERALTIQPQIPGLRLRVDSLKAARN
ncbi:MAG TPA: c-type cytochrome [Gemmatimonadaceae bacterium]|nr:c-type cytochrome [Gemmatimonadaceae bacterium]